MHSVMDGLLEAGCKVDVLTMSTYKFQVKHHDLPGDILDRIGFTSVDVDARIHPLGALFNLFSGASYHVSRFKSKDYQHQLEILLNENDYDLIQLEGVVLGEYLPTLRRSTRAPVVLRAHNIEHRIWDRISSNTHNPFKRWYLRLQARRLKSFEMRVWQEVDGIAAITPTDANQIAKDTNRPVVGIPFGIRPKEISHALRQNNNSLCHIGSMDWLPNLEGMDWFIEKCWPKIRKSRPDVKLHIAGRNFPERLLKMEQQGIIGLGEVEDAWSFLGANGILVVPLLSGSGIRIKIIEGMAAGKPIATTRIGAEGIECVSGEHLLISNSADELTENILRLLNDESLCERLGRNARKLVEEKYTIAMTTERFLEFYNRLGVSR